MNTEPAAVVADIAAPAAISIQGVSKTYGGPDGVLALQGITTEIRDREFVSVLGPSGCGKSTLLRIVGGLIPYEGDKVAVNGRPVTEPPPEIGMVFQTNNLLAWLTVEKNLRLGAEIRKLPPDQIKQKVAAMVDMLGLQGFEKNYPHELSGGMQQRVALGQTLTVDPSILLMDEPFGALDAMTRDRLNLELLRIWEKQRQTVFLVTHSITEAIFLSDRVLVMSPRPGRLIDDVGIDLPRPRTSKGTRGSSEFSAYVLRLSELMGVE